MEHKVYLDRNENNYGPSPRCFDILKNADHSLLSCYTKVYSTGVKSILSERLAKEVNLPEKRVLLGYGAEDLLKQAILCYLNKGEKLLIPSYSWWYYKELAGEAGGINIEYPLVEGTDSFQYNIEDIIKIYEREKPKVVLISSPNNPTGNSIALPDLKNLLKRLKESIVIFDQAYAFEGFNDQIESMLTENPNLIIIRTFSKYYALAGLRIGFALIGENIQKLTQLTNRYLGFNRLSEEVAIAALDSPEYYKTISNKMKNDKELYYSELGKLKGFKVYKSDANFILVKIPKEIYAALKEFMNKKGLIIKFMNEELLNSHLRITLGTEEQNLSVINAIKEFSDNSHF
ncbi:MAG: histidinol-phosphate aminotransferase family protein [Ignavibacteriaceae bacterium]|nr:histidinol-phosphate aminotransferase family protein [Ignavibacteriaceae bacterium]